MLVIGQAFVAAAIAATAWAAGRVVARGVRQPLPWALTMALGLAMAGQLLTLAGLAGVLRKPVVIAIVAGIHAAAIPAWRRLLMLWMPEGHRQSSNSGVWPAWLRLPVLLLVLTLLTAFVLTLYPPIGFDQTVYHLPLARAFAASGGLPFLPALRFPIFPTLAELLNAAVLMFAGDVATQAVGWVALVACVGLAYAWASDLARDANDASRSTSALASGSLAAATIAGSPIALYLAATGYVEPLLALLGGASLYLADRVRSRPRDVIETETLWLAAAAGLLAGSAASVKYHGLYFVLAAAILILWRAPRRAPRQTILRDLAIYGVAATAAMLPCYGRLLAQTGNPVFPFFTGLFGENPWGLQVMMGPSGAERWWLTLTRLWDITFRRDAIGHLPHYSPAFLLALPVIAIAAWRHRHFRLPLLIAIGYMVAAPTHAHYLLPIGVLWAALFGASALTLPRARAGLLIAAALILTCGGEAYAIYRLYRLGPPPVTSEGRDRLIASQRPLYPAVAWLNRHAGPVTVYAINAEMMVDYASGTLLGDHNGPASFERMEARVRSTGSAASALEAIDASHLLVPAEESFWNTEASRDPRLERVYADGNAIVYRLRK